MAHLRFPAGLLLALAGCAHFPTTDNHLRNKVAWDSGCPMQNVRVVRFLPHFNAAEVEACGEVLHYQNVGTDSVNWLDVTKRPVTPRIGEAGVTSPRQ